MATSLTFDLDVLRPGRARAAAARVIAARPQIPRPRSVRRPIARFGPPVRGFVGELFWAVLMMLMLALAVRVVFVFAAFAATPAPAAHVNEAITAGSPANRAGDVPVARAQASSEGASRTM